MLFLVWVKMETPRAAFRRALLLQTHALKLLLLPCRSAAWHPTVCCSGCCCAAVPAPALLPVGTLRHFRKKTGPRQDIHRRVHACTCKGVHGMLSAAAFTSGATRSSL